MSRIDCGTRDWWSICARIENRKLSQRGRGFGLTYIAFLLSFCLSELPKTTAQFEKPLQPLRAVVDLDVGESSIVELADGSRCTIQLANLREIRDDVCFAVRNAIVQVVVDGQTAEITSANYNRPIQVGQVQIDCPITQGYNQNGSASFWGLDKAARLRIWPANSPWIQQNSFIYPVKQKWFASNTQMANEPVFVDAGEKPGKRSIYYHSGLDIGGSEGLVEVVAATEGLVVSVGTQVLDAHRTGTPVAPRYDVVYLLDARGWYYRYSHFKEIDSSIVLGRVLRMGDRIGILGKEGGSGGWSHLHFEIKSKQPSGKWGTEEGYAYLWEAYIRQYQPKTIAVARPHHLLWSGDTVRLDGQRSWAADQNPLRFEWTFSDGTKSSGSLVDRTYPTPGKYAELLKVTDSFGNYAYDFADIYVYDRANPSRELPSIHANYFPTQGLAVGDEITFKVRTFGMRQGKESWDFGDGSPTVTVESDGNRRQLAPDGYAVTTHRFAQAGDYLVRVQRTDENGICVQTGLHVKVAPPVLPQSELHPSRQSLRSKIEPFFHPPEQFKEVYGSYRSPLLFRNGTKASTPEQWQQRRSELHQEWTESLGAWPPLIENPEIQILESSRRENFEQLKIRFRWTPTDYTVAYLLIPDGAAPKPAVLTVYYEPETAVGLKGVDRDFALQLVRKGFVCLSIGTTEATEAKTFSLYYPSLEAATVQPLSMLGYAAANAWYVLASRPDVDAKRIGIVGHSFGGKWAMFAACLFERFACAAWSDPGIVFDDTRSSINYWEPWYLGYHPKPWRERGLITANNPARGLYPKLRESGRDLHELHALMAPRPFLVSGGSEDPVERWVPLNHTIQINRLLGYEDRVAMTNRPDHAPNAQSNEILVAFFEYFLKQ